VLTLASANLHPKSYTPNSPGEPCRALHPRLPILLGHLSLHASPSSFLSSAHACMHCPAKHGPPACFLSPQGYGVPAATQSQAEHIYDSMQAMSYATAPWTTSRPGLKRREWCHIEGWLQDLCVLVIKKHIKIIGSVTQVALWEHRALFGWHGPWSLMRDEALWYLNVPRRPKKSLEPLELYISLSRALF